MLNPRWRKVLRDLRMSKTRTVMVVLSIAVGIFAFGSVFITDHVLVNSMNSQYRAINASTITIRMKSPDDGLARWARRQQEVTDAQVRAVYVVKLLKPDGEVNLDLYAFDASTSQRLNLPIVETGDWPPRRGQVFFERASVSLAGSGRTVTVETSAGHRRELNVAGTVHDLIVSPASMFPRLSGYISTDTLGELNLPKVYNRLELTVRDEFDTIPRLEKVADDLRLRLELAGVSVDSVEVRKPNEHWAQDTTQGFTLILTLIGIFSLILSAFLVVNTMSALLTEQRRQIGVMKAVGGTGWQITGIYLVMVAVYGLLALVVALPMGMGLAYLFTDSVSRFLNIDIQDFRLPGRVLLLQLGAALLVPLVASAVPVFGGVRTSIREAINNYGIGRRRHGLMDRLLLRVQRLPRPALLSLRGTFQRKGRLLLTLGTLTIAGTLFISVINVRGSLLAELDSIMRTNFNYEMQMSLDGHYGRAQAERTAMQVPGVVQVEGRTGVAVQRVKPDGSKSATINLIGLPPDSSFIEPQIISGRWLRAKDRNAVVISKKLADDMSDIKIGDTVTLSFGNEEYDWKVAGVASMAFDSVGIAYADFDRLSAVLGKPGLASSLYIRINNKDRASQEAMVKVIETHMKRSGISVGTSIMKDTIVSANASQFDFLIAFLLSMVAMTALVGGLGLAGMMSLNVMERTREIGVMRSIGASNAAIAGIVLTEGLLIGVISWVLAVPLSVPFSLMFNAMLGQILIKAPLMFVFSPYAVITWLGVVVAIATISSLLPAYRAVRMSIRETLAYE